MGRPSVTSYSIFFYTFDVMSPSDYLFSGNRSSARNVSDALKTEVYRYLRDTPRYYQFNQHALFRVR